MSSSVIYLSKSALKNNLKFVRKVVGKKPIISSVVKGNAYGHGFKEFIPLAEGCGVNHFSVFSQQEAMKVKKASKKNPTIMIMGVVSLKNLNWVIKNEVEFFVFNYKRLYEAIKTAKRLKKKAKIHVEVETGMNRTGFSEWELEKLIQLLKVNDDHLELIGLCTHYSGAESVSNYYRIRKQIKRFKKYVKHFESNDIKPKLLHSASSAAAVTLPMTKMDLVRVGILQYGEWPSDETFMYYVGRKKDKTNPLKPVLSWKSEVMSIKRVEAGDYVGYGDYYLAKEEKLIATVPVGYCEGYSRQIGNDSKVIVGGNYANIVGLVNMNLMQIDITDFSGILIGDEVMLIGGNGDKKIKFSSFRDRTSVLNYDILSRLSESILRVVVK